MADKPKSGMKIASLGLLGLMFVYLKLTHQIDWSWWWVTFPFWGPFALAACVYILFLALAGIVILIASLVEILERK